MASASHCCCYCGPLPGLAGFRLGSSKVVEHICLSMTRGVTSLCCYCGPLPGLAGFRLGSSKVHSRLYCQSCPATHWGKSMPQMLPNTWPFSCVSWLGLASFATWLVAGCMLFDILVSWLRWLCRLASQLVGHLSSCWLYWMATLAGWLASQPVSCLSRSFWSSWLVTGFWFSCVGHLASWWLYATWYLG